MKQNCKSIAITLLYIIWHITPLFAQESVIKGHIVEGGTDNSLPGVIVTNGKNRAITDDNGRFSIKQDLGVDSLVLSCVGYINTIVRVGQKRDLGRIEMPINHYILEDVTIRSQLAVPRKTPVVASNIHAIEIEERLGNNEFVEALKYTPGVHANKQSGSWCESEIFMRGFSNDNIAVMVNGIPVNDMETGYLYWSNWVGLSDVTTLMQTQRGIGANKVSAPSVGGTINIITRGIDTKKGGSVYHSIGNDGYQKTSFSLSTGLLKHNWAINILGSYTKGDGYAQGTNFEGYSYFINVSKLFNDRHQINLTAFGAPQWHYRRSNALTETEWAYVKDTYAVAGGWRRYNPDFGFNKNGVRKTGDYEKFHFPIVSLKHIWQLSQTANITTTAYGIFSSGGGYGGKANSDEYSEYDWYGSDYGILNRTFRCDDGTFDYGKIEEINRTSDNGSQMIMTQIQGTEKRLGLMSTFSQRSFDCLDWFVGLDFRYFKSLHANKIVDLFGGEYYIDPSRQDVDINNNANATDVWKNQPLHVGDMVYRHYNSHIMQEGIFGQVEYSHDKFNAFLSGALNYSDYWRYDHLYYDSDNAESDKIGFWGGNVKAGINYNINDKNNVFVNVGYVSKAPQFKSGAFMSANSSNIINDKVKNEKAFTAEVGYAFCNDFMQIKANAYLTRWLDKSMTKKGKLTEQYYINMTGVNSKHVGIELETQIRPAHWVDINAMLSVGSWKWDSDNVTGYAYDIYGQALTPEGAITTPGAAEHAKATINMKGVHIGGSAQTTAGANVTFKPFAGFKIGGGYTFYDRNFAYYSLSGSSLSIGKDLYVSEPWKMPSHNCVDLWCSYNFDFLGLHATFSGQVSNVLDNHYIEKAWNPTNVGKEVTEVNAEDVYFFYSIGRTWSVKLKVDF